MSEAQDASEQAAPQKDVDGEVETHVRSLVSWPARVFAACGIAISLFHIWANIDGRVSTLWLVGIHFAGFAFLACLRYPMKIGRFVAPLWLDATTGAVIAGATLFIIGSETAIYAQGVRLSPEHWVAGILVILGAIELTRRTTGPIIPVLIVLALSYVSFLGAYAPGVFRFAGLSTETVLFRSIFADEGMFGTIGRISASFVFMFILFGAFLVRSGAGDFIIDLARALAGRLVGGPGFVAVFASGLTGTISGSAVANTVSTGVITIPLMKKSGFPPRFAAGVEAAASTGGQLMPPIMGAGAFVMASNTQIPYLDIVAVATLPAIAYFLTVAFFVRIEAKKHHIVGVDDESRSAWEVLKAGGPAFLVPVATLIGLLIYGFTPVYAAGWAILSVVAASWLTKNRMGPKAILEALALGAQNMIMTAVLLIAVGLIVNVIAMTGIGNTFSLMIAEWAGGNLLIALLLIALASLVLGMGLPVTAAYIVLATLSAPALQGMIENGYLVDLLTSGTLPEAARGPFLLADPEAMTKLAAPMSREAANAFIAAAPAEVLRLVHGQALDPALITAALLSAHMIIFWLSQDSNVTPPVCLTAFAAAAIARTPHMATGMTAWKLAKGLYIVPILFAYTPFLHGSVPEVLLVFAQAVIGSYAVGAAFEGYMEAPLAWPLRLLAGVAGVVVLWPGLPVATAIGAAMTFALLLWTIRLDRRGRAAEALA
ncbi:TRAP transporter fused permease subunit [Afifella sp. JA880]|uniref:TRAP transporter permease n=1 Tax=Afifella sp. JA880 TaxID=2975280 RepID=UPI0021BAE9FA|nr:TRAP transporter fused permease subunit [Afifella sp. JA880]MCT8268334.1 TRAP transporter fused permease subunit [Afifella sp. JA880]